LGQQRYKIKANIVIPPKGFWFFR